MKIYRQNELTVNRVLFSNAASAACEVIHISVYATDDSIFCHFWHANAEVLNMHAIIGKQIDKRWI